MFVWRNKKSVHEIAYCSTPVDDRNWNEGETQPSVVEIVNDRLVIEDEFNSVLEGYFVNTFETTLHF